MLRAAYSSVLLNTSSVTVMVPGKRICDVGGLTEPSGTYAITGATIALPSSCAILPDSAFTLALCLPSARPGPLCSVPPMGASTVVFPDAISLRSSVQVKSSRKTLGKGGGDAGCAGSDADTKINNPREIIHREFKRALL